MYQPKDLTTFPIESGAPQPYPYGGRTMSSIIERLRRPRTSAIARWRPRLLLRGWRQICFYSFDLATSFLQAFCRLAPRLGLKEMALWTDCAVKLARCDRELAAQFLSESADLLLRVPAGVSRLFCQAIVGRDSWYRRDLAAARYRDGFALRWHHETTQVPCVAASVKHHRSRRAGRWHYETIQMPRVATTVKLHRASRWHHEPTLRFRFAMFS